MKKALFLNPSGYKGIDASAGAHYQAKREIRSFWYPNWLAQPAVTVSGNRVVDAAPDRLTAGTACSQLRARHVANQRTYLHLTCALRRAAEGRNFPSAIVGGAVN